MATQKPGYRVCMKWYLVTVPSATNHLRKSWSTGPSSTLLPKDFLPMRKVVFETTFGWAGNLFPGQFHVIVPSGCIDAAKCPSVLSASLTKQTWEFSEFVMYSLSTSISFPQQKNAWAASLRAKVAQVETSWWICGSDSICVIIGQGHVSKV